MSRPQEIGKAHAFDEDAEPIEADNNADIELLVRI